MHHKTPRTALATGPSDSFQQLASWYLREYMDKIQLALEGLSEEEIWWRPSEAFNSIGNLLLHLHGNLSLWVLRGLGGEPYERHRSAEFTSDRSSDGVALLANLEAVIARCESLLREVPAEALDAVISIQTYRVRGMDALFHAVEHCSYHTGQIVQTAKQLRGSARPLEFYPRHADE